MSRAKTQDHKDKLSNALKGIKRTEEQKNNSRLSRIKFLSNPENQRKTVWHRKGQMTFGENWLHSIFTELDFYSKYDIVNEFCEFPYYIDFAFVNEKVAVEFDGAVHFKNGNERIQHDIKRDKLLQEKGWRIFRIAYFEIKTFKINDLINFIGDVKKKEFSNQLIKYNEYKLLKPKKRKSRYNLTSKEYHQQNRDKYNKLYEPLIKQIENSGIDFTKSTWPGEVAKILGKTSNLVSKWLKRFMPEFYNLIPYKRRGSKTK